MLIMNNLRRSISSKGNAPVTAGEGRARLRRAVTFSHEIEFRLDGVSPYHARLSHEGVKPGKLNMDLMKKKIETADDESAAP